MKTINSLKISIPIMFERIGCNSDEYTRDLGEDFVIFIIFLKN